MNTATLNEILAHPTVAQHLDAETPQRIDEHLNQQAKTSVTNGITRFFAGLGAWVSAVCFLAFLGMADLLDSAGGAYVIGAICAIAGIVLGRTTKAAFPDQLGLALTICGNLAIVIGCAIQTDFHLPQMIFVHAVAGTILYAAFPSAVYRFLSPLALSLLATTWIFTENDARPFLPILIALQTALIGLLHLRLQNVQMLRPFAYSAALMLPGTILFFNLWQMNTWLQQWEHSLFSSSAALTIALCLLVWRAAKQNQLDQARTLGLIAASIALGVFTTPGILIAIGLLVLGHLSNDVRLTRIAHVFLAAFLWFYYYRMDVDLAYKSYIVAGSGILLLAARPLFNLKPANENPA